MESFPAKTGRGMVEIGLQVASHAWTHLQNAREPMSKSSQVDPHCSERTSCRGTAVIHLWRRVQNCAFTWVNPSPQRKIGGFTRCELIALKVLNWLKLCSIRVSGKIECNFHDREGKRYGKLSKTLLRNFNPKLSEIALHIGQGNGCHIRVQDGKNYRKLCQTLLRSFGPKLPKIALNIGQGSKWMQFSCLGWLKS